MAVSNGTLQAVFALQDNYTIAIRKILRSQEDYEKKQQQIDKATEVFQNRLENMSGKADNASGGIGRLVGKLTALVSVTYLAKKGLDAMIASLNTSAMQQMQENTFGALLNNQAAGSAVYAYISAYAKKSMLGREDIAKGMTTFLTYSRDMNQLERMVKMTERLYAKDPTQGTEGAVFALKEILSGDTLSMRNRFNITGFDGASIRAKMGAGDVAGALDEIDAVMTKYGASQAVVDANMRNMTVQANIFKTNLKSAFGEEVTPLMEQFGAMWARINENFEAGKYQPFIDTMVSGFRAVGTLAIWAADNINILIPVVGGLVTAIMIYNAAKTVATILEAASIPVTWAAIGPYVLLAAAILGVAAAFGIASGGMDKFTSKLGASLGVDEARSLAATHLDKLPVEISNTDPISVKGSVTIEEENIKALMDVAGMKFFAQYSNITPQLVVQNANFNNNTDMNDLMGVLGEFLESARAAQPEGLPA